MEHAPVSLLASWDSFYVIIGSSSAALTGLMFVVISLIPDSRVRAADGALSAFGTPTVVHFCTALLVSSILSAPWPALAQAGVAVAVCGFAGVAYSAIVTWRSYRQTQYKPVLEDWLWHSVFPFIAYVTVSAAGITLADHPLHAPFWLAAATISLLFIGIHNAWDQVLYITLARAQDAKPKPHHHLETD